MHYKLDMRCSFTRTLGFTFLLFCVLCHIYKLGVVVMLVLFVLSFIDVFICVQIVILLPISLILSLIACV